MKEWIGMLNDLETDVLELDSACLERISTSIRPKKRPFRLVFAFVAVLILSACGYAATQFSAWFPHLTNPYDPGAQEDLLAAVGTVIDQTQSVDGVTVTLHGALWDGWNLMLSLSADDGAALSEEGAWLWYSRAQFEENIQSHPHGEDLEAYYEVMAKASGIRLKAGEVCTIYKQLDSDAQSVELVLHLEEPVPMDFPFRLNRTQAAREWAGNWELSSGVTVTHVTVTPLEARVTCTGTGQPPPMDLTVYAADTPLHGPTGDQIEYTPTGWTRTLRIGPVDRIYDPETVTRVEVNGELVELPPEGEKP